MVFCASQCTAGESVCYSLVSETTSVSPSKQCSCRGLGTILQRHWFFPMRNGWKLCIFPFFSLSLSPEPDCATLCWPMNRSAWLVVYTVCWEEKWQRHVDLISPFFPLSPDVSCFIYSNHTSNIWCYNNVLAFCCCWSSCHAQFTQFVSGMNNPLFCSHHHLVECAVLIISGLDVFNNDLQSFIF